MTKIAFIFPGQGSQYSGMGRSFATGFPRFLQVFEEANERLGFDLLKTVLEGSNEDLMKTEVTQPAILTLSVAILEIVKEKFGSCGEFAAGLSLGEYAALVYSGVLKFSDAVFLAQKRGQIMQEAVPEGVGAMAPVIGAKYDEVADFIKQVKGSGVVEISNFNAPDQVVLSGNREAVSEAVNLIKKHCRVKAVFLPVSAPFHTSLLRNAADKFAEVIDNIELLSFGKKVVSNVTGELITSVSEVKELLVRQFYSTVLWKPSVEFMMNQGVDSFVEIGPGISLSGLVRKTAAAAGKEVKIQNVEDMETFKKLNF